MQLIDALLEPTTVRHSFTSTEVQDMLLDIRNEHDRILTEALASTTEGQLDALHEELDLLTERPEEEE